MWDQNGDTAKDPFLSRPIGPLGIIAMRGTEELGALINSYLIRWRDGHENSDEELFTSPGYERDSFLVEAACPRFGTGEAKGMIRQSVRGYDLYILCDVGAHNCTYPMYGQQVPMSPDEHYQDLKRIIAAAGGKSKRINVIMPMLYEGRQHRRASRESLDCALMLQELERMGVSNIITFDAHDPRVQNAVPLCGFENIMPYYQNLKALCRTEKDLIIDKDHMMIVSPDEGAMGRNMYYSSVLGIDMGMFYKRRDYTRICNGRNPIVAHEYLGADLEGKDVLITDDMISTGESMLDVAQELKIRRARRIFVAATFAYFTNGLADFDKAYKDGLISKVLSTNLTYLPPELRSAPWFTLVDMSKYLSYIVAILNHDRSLNNLLNPVGRITKLLGNYRDMQARSGIRMF
ncbi:MAG: ribose-phosphate pyrophosphokinase [Oscillospiraceae bacterium]|jgi:ribose-phosphate pyrophosphokinase|nr:ribose-phosphate pyrophosphokinase [Oscillospiraceae bacterium]